MARDHPDVPLFETLLDAFQSGLLEDFAEPKPNGLAELEQRMHDQRFACLAGAGWRSRSWPPEPCTGVSGCTDLPARLAADLDALNALRREADQNAFHADWYRWQLFTDWYRIFMADPDTRTAAVAIATQRYGNWQAIDRQREASEAAAARQRDAVLKLSSATASSCAPGPPPPSSSQRTRPSSSRSTRSRFPPATAATGGSGRTGTWRAAPAAGCSPASRPGGTTLTADSLTGVTAPATLPDADLVTALPREACLLWPTLMAQLTGIDAARLQAALSWPWRASGRTSTRWSASRPPRPG